MDAILPIKSGLAPKYSPNRKNDHKNYNYNAKDVIRAKILIYSIEKFWFGDQQFELHIICPDEELAQTSKAIEKNYERVKLNFVAESAIVPELSEFQNISGWYKQQIIKLASYRLVKSGCYLLLDADLVACQPFKKESFFYNNKIINDWESRAIHASWWETSAALLGAASDPANHGLKPTPVVVSTNICGSLHEFLNRRYDRSNWRPLLERLGWSEFSLYNVFMDTMGLGAKYHCTQQEVQKLGLAVRSPHSFSNAKGFAEWQPQRAFLPNAPGKFMVCNSNSRVLPKQIWQKLMPNFEDAPDYCFFDE